MTIPWVKEADILERDEAGQLHDRMERHGR